MTRLGILSAAHLHAHAYADILTELDGVTVAGVADTDADRGRGFAADHDLKYRDRDALLESVDGAVVCAANTAHDRWVRAAAEAGVDVLCEKPLATTAATAADLVGACEEAGVALAVAMPLRHSTPAREARRLVRDGGVGEVRSLSGTNRGTMPGDWFIDPELSGGGAVMDHTVHIVDLAHWLLDTRVTEVYAETATRMHDIPVEDVNHLSMRLADGTTLLLDGSWSRPDGAPFWGDATLEVIGTEGTANIECFGQRFDRIDADGVSSVYWGDDPNEGMLRRFVETVRDGCPPATSGTDGVAAVAVVEAAYESAETGQPVTVAYDAI